MDDKKCDWVLVDSRKDRRDAYIELKSNFTHVTHCNSYILPISSNTVISLASNYAIQTFKSQTVIILRFKDTKKPNKR